MQRDELIQEALERIRIKTGKVPKESGGRWQCLCPAHEDKNESLSVTPGEKGVVFKCFAGCGFAAIAESLGFEAEELFYERRGSANEREGTRIKTDKGKRKRPLTINGLAMSKGLEGDFLRACKCYEEGGTVRIPYLLADMTPAPRVRIRSALRAKDGSTWSGKGSDGGLVPYGLWRLATARRDKMGLVLVEGETDCWSLWCAGFAALGLPGASMAKKILPEYVEGFSRIFIVMEPDKGGLTFARGVAERLRGLGWEGVLKVVGCGSHGDPNGMLKAMGDDFAGAFKARMRAARLAVEVIDEGPEDYTGAMVADLFLRFAPAPRLFSAPRVSAVDERRIVFFRGGFYEFTGQCYRELPEGDLMARVVGFIRSREWIDRKGKVSTPSPKGSFARDVCLNIAASAPIPSHALPPIWEDGSDASRVLALENGLFDCGLNDERATASADYADCADKRNDETETAGEGNGNDETETTTTLADGMLRAHSPGLFSLNALPYRFEAGAKCPRWLAFLDEVLPMVEGEVLSAQGVLQEWCGYCLLPTNEFQRFLVLVGEGSNGKSVFQGVLRRLVGERNCSAVSLDQLHDSHALEPLVGKLLNISGEWEHIRSEAVNVLKAVSGGTPVNINPKHKAGYEVLLTTRFCVSTNEPPRVADRSEGVWRRMLAVPFSVEIPPERRRPLDPFVEELCGELPGILLWALRGLYRLQRRGRFEETVAMMALKGGIRSDSNPAGLWCEDNLEVADMETTCGEVYSAYREAMKVSGHKPMNAARFGREVGRWWRRHDSLTSVSRVQRRGAGGRRFRVYEHVALAAGEVDADGRGIDGM